MLKTTYFCGWMLANQVDIKQSDKLCKWLILDIFNSWFLRGYQVPCVKLGTHTSFVLWIVFFLHCNWYLFCTLNSLFSSLKLTPILYFELLIFFTVIDTYFALWIAYFLNFNWYLFCTLNFSSLNNLFFFIVIDNCEEKLALWHIAKHNSTEGFFNDYFCLINWYFTGSCLKKLCI